MSIESPVKLQSSGTFCYQTNEEDKVVKAPFYGPRIGTYLGKPIYHSLEYNGDRYEYNRLASCNDEGCPLQQLKHNEVLFKPGLIYRLAG